MNRFYILKLSKKTVLSMCMFKNDLIRHLLRMEKYLK